MLSGLRRAINHRRYSATLPPIARQVKDEGLTYLSAERMASIVAETARIEKLGIDGDLAEFGIALGGSSIVIASLRGARRFTGYDVFGMIPEPGERDADDAHSRYRVIKGGTSSGIKGKQYYGYRSDLYSEVRSSFERHGLTVDDETVALRKGLFQDTFRPAAGDRLAFAHIDCDWYDPVYFCMTAVAPILSPGGTIVVDDYNDYQGCRKAVDRALAEDRTISLHRTKPHAIIRKAA